MPLIRLAEWQKQTVSSEWTRDAREAIADLALLWKNAHPSMNALPLEWGGTDGQTLSVRQWVGVLEWGEFRVEIYPKLDEHLLGSGGEINETLAGTLLRDLLAMIEAADYDNWLDNGRAALEFEPLQFADVWAYLLGKNLSRELRNGLTHAYIPMSDDLPAVRGKIAVSRQITRHFNRADKIACEWDEWSGDNALNRLLKCAGEFLKARVSHTHSRTVLNGCLWLLDEVATVSPREALAQTQHFAFSRATRRFQNAFELSRRLLASQSPDFGAHDAQSWVFLTDMNQLFEKFCARALEAKTGVEVQTQAEIGTLFLNPAGIQQKPDFLWRDGANWQVGDAKWKLMNQTAPEFAAENDTGASQKLKISPDDVRQLTVYSEILKRRDGLETPPDMTIFYPSLSGDLVNTSRKTWNGARLKLCPVCIKSFGDWSEVLA